MATRSGDAGDESPSTFAGTMFRPAPSTATESSPPPWLKTAPQCSPPRSPKASARSMGSRLPAGLLAADALTRGPLLKQTRRDPRSECRRGGEARRAESGDECEAEHRAAAAPCREPVAGGRASRGPPSKRRLQTRARLGQRQRQLGRGKHAPAPACDVPVWFGPRLRGSARSGAFHRSRRSLDLYTNSQSACKPVS